MNTLDVPPAPRGQTDGIVVFACEHAPNGKDFLEIQRDPPKQPRCTTCGALARHVGPDALYRILEKHGAVR